MSTLAYQALINQAQQAACMQQTQANLYINTAATTNSTSVYFANATTTTTAGLGQNSLAAFPSRTRISAGYKFDLELPDGAFLRVAEDGSYQIDDKDAKVTYRANRVREFNRFLNASDLLVKFIEYLNSLHLNQKEALGLPIDLFIAWLIIEAAKADGEEPEEPEVTKLDALVRKRAQIDPSPNVLLLPASMPRCFCGRFMGRQRAARGLMFCSGLHMDRYESRAQIQATHR